MLSAADPVRVFQEFATLDLVSRGRAEMIVGRGSFIESFPLFGYDLEDYDLLFAEKLQLLMEIRENEVVTWEGQTRKPIQGRGVYPRPLQDLLPLWIAIGGTPQSDWIAENAWRYGFIVRYEQGRTATTGYSAEPWHLRFIGRELAGAYADGGFHTLEEFFGLEPAPDYG